jgi:hypothetical protein
VIWTRTHKLLLTLGVLLWIGGAVLTPGEIAAAKKKEPIRARTTIALLAFMSATFFVLAGLPRKEPQELPKR